MTDDPRLVALRETGDPRLVALNEPNDPRLDALAGYGDPRLDALAGHGDRRRDVLEAFSDGRRDAPQACSDPRIDALRAGGAASEIASPSLESGPNRSDLEALKEGAAMMIQAGNRVAALALLWSAVAIDPTDLTAHRRLAATLAFGGDIDGAADEYARYIEFTLPLGEVGRATMELSYGASVLGAHPALHAAAEKIVTAVRAIVPATNVAIASTVAPTLPTVAPTVSILAPAAPIIAPAAPILAPITPITAPAAPPSAPVAPIFQVALPAPRLLPKVPFRFCVHQDGDRHWMQLEGGTAELVPVTVRLVDRAENVIETRLCLPLELGEKGHARVVDDDEPSVAWAVVAISSDVVAAIDAGKPSPYGVQAKVGDEWLATALVDTGCRLGRTRANSAVS